MAFSCEEVNSVETTDNVFLQVSADLGLKLKERGTHDFYQSLTFLVRDWEWPDEYEYGEDGGTIYIHSELQVRNQQTLN